MARQLTQHEIAELLCSDSVLYLATIDHHGYPHITPLWFLWDGEAIFATSKIGAPHLDRLAANPRVGLLVDQEDAERPDGERPNRQFRAVADAEVVSDSGGHWTAEITRKYIRGDGRDTRAQLRAAQQRMALKLVPRQVVALSSV